MITGRELIQWIRQNDAEDLPVAVQYRDGGGDYIGFGDIYDPEIVTVQGDGYDYEYYKDGFEIIVI